MPVSVSDAAQEGTGGMHDSVQDPLEMHLLCIGAAFFVLFLACLQELAGHFTLFQQGRG